MNKFAGSYERKVELQEKEFARRQKRVDGGDLFRDGSSSLEPFQAIFQRTRSFVEVLRMLHEANLKYQEAVRRSADPDHVTYLEEAYDSIKLFASSMQADLMKAAGISGSYEPAGPGQNLPAAGILVACAASLATDATWLRVYLTRTLLAFSLPHSARDGLIEQALEIASSPQPMPRAVDVADAYLNAPSFGQSQAIPLISAILEADVMNSTVYDARAREAVTRYISALSLPPRILYSAEHQLAELVCGRKRHCEWRNRRICGGRLSPYAP
ncbi:unnamed protein product [Agarophyton chilense]